MLADRLIARAQRCAELNHMLAENAGHEDAPDWISEISAKALNRREERHVAIVRQVNHLHIRIATAQAMTTKDDTDRDMQVIAYGLSQSAEAWDRLTAE